MRIRAVIFDFDQVLIDSYKDHLDAFVLAAKKFGVELNKSDVKKIYHKFGKSAKEIMEDIRPQMTSAEIKKFTEEKDRIYRKIITKRGVKLMKGAKEILIFLKQKKMKIAIASSATRKNIMIGLKKNKIERFFPVIVSAEDTKRHKPFPDPLLKTARLLKVKPRETVYIGDTTYEIISAKRARMIGIAVKSGLYSTENLKKHGAKKVFENLFQLKKFFEKNKFTL